MSDAGSQSSSASPDHANDSSEEWEAHVRRLLTWVAEESEQEGRPSNAGDDPSEEEGDASVDDSKEEDTSVRNWKVGNYFVCKHCEEQFLTLEELGVHVRSDCEGDRPARGERGESGAQRAISGQEDLSLGSQPSEADPLDLGQDTGKRFLCTYCTKSFDKKSNYNNHLRTHTGEKPYACVLCDKCFRTNTHLSLHMRTHTGEKPFACVLCDKSFNRNTHLASHMRTHTGERKYACEVCDKKFSQKSDVTRHMRVHTGEKPYSCVFCGKSFNRKTHMFLHMRMHTGDLPYVCDICNKAFPQERQLTVHQRTHTKIKPFPCEVCSKTFLTNAHVARHMRVHLKDQPKPTS